jgi:hypothetical protein
LVNVPVLNVDMDDDGNDGDDVADVVRYLVPPKSRGV